MVDEAYRRVKANAGAALPEVRKARLPIKVNDIDTSELNCAINEQDDYALEEGLKLKEKERSGFHCDNARRGECQEGDNAAGPG